MKQSIYRHGDLGFTKEKIDTSSLTKVGTKRHVLAEGETTGHKHVIVADTGTVDIYKDANNELVLVINGKALVSHEEHKTIEIPTGTYRMRNQREYDYFALSTTRVLD